MAHDLKQGVGAEDLFFMGVEENRVKTVIEKKQLPAKIKSNLIKKGKIGETVELCF